MIYEVSEGIRLVNAETPEEAVLECLAEAGEEMDDKYREPDPNAHFLVRPAPPEDLWETVYPDLIPAEMRKHHKLMREARFRGGDYIVSDSKGIPIGGRIPVIGIFEFEEDAAEFIGTLPEHETGRYNLDGPADG